MDKQESFIPQQVAEIIFRNEPEEPKKYSLLCENEEHEEIEPVELFEIFLTILMEGVMIKNDPITFDKVKEFTPEVILNLNPWLKSLGFYANVQILTKANVEEYNKFYSKIVMKCDPSWKNFFTIHKNITKDYHFIISQLCPYVNDQYCDLTNLYAVFIIKDTVYKITFSCL